MKKISIYFIIVALVAVWIGYMMGSNDAENRILKSAGMHMMPNGEVMSNNAATMSMGDMMSSMNAELVGKSGDAFDQSFLEQMIVHHQGAVEMAELAIKNAKHQEIIDLAHAIISAQNKEIGDMKSWQSAWYK